MSKGRWEVQDRKRWRWQLPTLVSELHLQIAPSSIAVAGSSRTSKGLATDLWRVCLSHFILKQNLK